MSFETIKIDNDIERLQKQLDSEKRKVYGKGNPGDQMRQYKTGSSQYQEAKKKFDAIYPEYEAKQKEITDQINALESQKQKVVQKEEQKKTASKKEDSLTKAKDEYQRALDSKNAQRITDAKKNLDNLGAPTSDVAEDNKPSTPQEDYAGYTLDSSGTVFGPGADGANGLAGIFVPMADSKGNVVNQFVTSTNKAIEGFLKQYQGPGQIQELQKKLLASGYIKQSQVGGTAWLSGLVDMLGNYSSDYLYKIKFQGATDVPGIDVFMSQKKPGSGTSATPYRTITTRGDAKKLLDGYMNDLVGRPSSTEEESAFYEQLNKAENKAVRYSSAGMTTGSVLTEGDRLMIAAKVARKTLRGTNVDELLKSNIGSTVALDVAAMQKYAARYGIDMTPAEALKRVADGIGQENYAAKQQERLRQLSMTLHPYLKDHIAAGGTVEDVANVYANSKLYKLGVAVPTATKDKDVMNAIASGKTVADFERELQADPLWRRTDEARKLSADFTSTMLKTFGLG
jgi:hypothetical protein